MPVKVRNSVFETNSSSSHSLTICLEQIDFKADYIPVDDNGVCRIYPGEFGWGYDKFNDAPIKASYCFTYATNGEENKQNWNNEEIEMLTKVIKEMTGAKEVSFEKMNDNYYPYGYIDHQSNRGESDICSEAFQNEDSLKSFIFNPKSILIIDSDN